MNAAAPPHLPATAPDDHHRRPHQTPPPHHTAPYAPSPHVHEGNPLP